LGLLKFQARLTKELGRATERIMVWSFLVGEDSMKWQAALGVEDERREWRPGAPGMGCVLDEAIGLHWAVGVVAERDAHRRDGAPRVEPGRHGPDPGRVRQV
jgi:hypothetical protein